jgi:hypothetical protein
MVIYTYTKADVDAHQLAVEVVASGITTPLDYINTSSEADAVDVVFQATLSGTEEAALDEVVDGHVAGTCDQAVKIYKYIQLSEDYDIHDPPIGLNYITGLTTKLFPKRTMTKGEVNKVDYYADEELTDLVLTVDISYNRDQLGLATDRTVTRTWIKEDGQPHCCPKVTKKIYTINIEDQIKEAHRRRENIVDKLLLVVLGMMIATNPEETLADVLTDARNFVFTYKTEFDTFESSGGTEIITTVSGATVDGIIGNWLDNVIDGEGTTIRQYMMVELDYLTP